MKHLITWLVWVLVVAAVAIGIMLAVRDWNVKHHDTEGFEPGLPPP